MKAIHLAAGQGTRLRPLTNDRPKPLVELAGRSLLEHNVRTLEAAGVDEQVVVTGYEADRIEAVRESLGIETVHNDVYDETEMIYSLFRARERFSDDDLLVSYGDIVYERSVAARLLACDAPLCLVVDRDWRRLWEARFDDPLSDAETLRLDADDRVLEIGADPDGYDGIDAQYTGLFTVRADHVDAFVAEYESLEAAAEGFVSIESTAFIQRLIDDGWHVQGVPIEGGWLEVDTLADLEHYRDLAASGDLTSFVSLDDR